mgnify:CR=1 FL=1
MKLQSLEMTGFGPFAKKTKIDFQPFHAAPILLIHGRTGAGKTSVLDAITYALYGRASGMDGRTPDTLRSQMILDTEETLVQLTFQLRDQRYRASRSPEYLRPKKRGEGWIKESPTALLEHWEEGRWKPKATRVNEVNLKVESLLGFSYEQFTQVLILPQGKFRQMLIADSVQRRDIFRQLFRTGDLESMQQRMRDDTAKMRKAIEEKKIRIDELFGQLEGIEGTVVTKLEEAHGLCGQMDRDIQGLEIDLVRDRETLKNVRGQRDRVLKRNQIEESLLGWEKRLEGLVGKSQEIEALKAQRDLGERAQEIRTEKEAFDRSKRQVESDEIRLQSISQQLEVAQAKNENNPQEESLREEILELKERMRVQKERKRLKHILVKNARRQKTIDYHLEKSKAEKNVHEERKQILTDRLSVIQEQMREERAYVLAKDLEEGAPCPVCGSIHHPKLAAAIEVDPEEEARIVSEISKVDQALTKLSDHMITIQSDLAMLQGGRSSFLDQLNALPEGKEIAEETLDKKIASCQQQIESSRRVREEWTRLKGQAALAEDQWKKQKGNVEKLQDAWEKARTRNGFPSDEAYGRASISYADLQVMNRRLQQHQLDLAEAERQLVALKLQLEQEPVENQMDLTDLDRLVEEWTKTIDERTKELAEKTNRYKTYERTVNRLQVELEDKSAAEKTFGDLAWMADVASGRNSQGMDFEQYVLRRYLAEVLRVANGRLNILTDGRYELTMQDERRDRRKRFGLELDVFDFYTGDKRPVGSLSGGESFKASLALALALSDVVRSFAGGIELETLFIDEGFGTLDPSSLDSAVEVLVELKQQNRLVGIISHVPELKERIDNRIEVVKNRGKQGSRIFIHLPGGGSHEAMPIQKQ